MSSQGGHQSKISSTETPRGVRLPPYHDRLSAYFQQHRQPLWNWFSTARQQRQAAEKARLELLKSAYRMDRESEAVLYLQCDAVARRMQLDVPITLYQAQHATGLNASLIWIPEQAHVVFHGPVRETLSERETEALLTHELAHFELLSLQEGVCGVLEEILTSMLTDRSARPAHERTWRNYRLYTELHCDRRAAEITEDRDACISALVKMETGLKEVSAAGYVKQAEEILTQDSSGSEGFTHPEMFLRARALQWWSENPDTCDQLMQPLIQGPLALKSLDLLQQQSLADFTQNFLQHLLQPSWMQTSILLGHAKQFFEDFSVGASMAVDADAEFLQTVDADLCRYFCFVLLDFATCDPDLEEAALAQAVLVAQQIGVADMFRKLAADELKLGKRTLQRIEKNAASIVQQAATELAQ